MVFPRDASLLVMTMLSTAFVLSIVFILPHIALMAMAAAVVLMHTCFPGPVGQSSIRSWRFTAPHRHRALASAPPINLKLLPPKTP